MMPGRASSRHSCHRSIEIHSPMSRPCIDSFVRRQAYQMGCAAYTCHTLSALPDKAARSESCAWKASAM
jgi:hypothetical protein